ncbi:MAG: c-type cytochrome [Pedosphaera sp.]|nr:c-type cytochrome [Pedosphaera sp.]
MNSRDRSRLQSALQILCSMFPSRLHPLVASVRLTALALAFLVQLPVAHGQAPVNRLPQLAMLIRDPSPKVRLEALRALARIPSVESATLALTVLDLPMDSTLDYGLWLTINDLAEPWLAAFESGSWKPDGRENQLEFALKAVKPAQASRVLGKVLRDRPLDRNGSGPWIELIGQAGGGPELARLFQQTLSGGFGESAAVRALKSLTEASRLRKAMPDGDRSDIGRFIGDDRLPATIRAEALRLGAQWKTEGNWTQPAFSLAGNATTPPGLRETAFNSLRAVGGKPVVDGLAELMTSATPAIQSSASVALAGLDLGKAVPGLITAIQGATDEPAAVEFWRAVLPVKGAGKAIATALPATGIPPAAARAGMRVAREGGRNEMELVIALAKSGGLAADAQAFTGQLIQEIASKAALHGNPARGQLVFRRADLACITCHAIGGAGGKVGPDMTSIGASAPMDYLVESVLLPNVKIKEGFNGIAVSTRDGQEYNGVLVRESPTELVLRDAANHEVSIAKNSIESRQQSAVSLMPAGLLDNLPEADQLDLYAFMSQLGKPGDYDASRGGAARKWWLANVMHTDMQDGQGDWIWKKPLEDKRWTGIHTFVNGSLPREQMNEASKAQVWISRIALCAATEVTVVAAGPIQFELTANPSAELWVDGKKIGNEGTSRTELTAGTHRVIVRLDPKAMPPTLSLRSSASLSLN